MYLLINYSVYRKLFGVEDSKIYQRIWSLQKMCPIIILYNSLSVQPGKFMAEVCPLKKAIKVDPPDIMVFIKQSLQASEAQFGQKIG